MSIVFDTTGSMSRRLDGLIACTSELASGLDRSGLDWRMTAVPFGDLTVPGDSIDSSLPWVAEAPAAHIMLKNMRRNFGGVNAGESCLEAVHAALAKKGRSRATSVMLVITDEPALTHQHTPESAIAALVARDVLCTVIGPDLAYYRAMAARTGGRWLPIFGQVDLTRFVTDWARLGAWVAGRVQQVAQVGGSPAALLALESSSR